MHRAGYEARPRVNITFGCVYVCVCVCVRVQIRALAEARSWDALDAFAGEKKSPIGYEPFLEVAKRFGAPREVQAR